MLPDGLRKLPEGLLLKPAAGLPGIGDDALDGHLVDAVGLVETVPLLFHRCSPFSGFFSILRLVR
mgnify:CR=1 FL=1